MDKKIMNQVTSSTFLIIFLALSVIPSSTFFGIESVRASADIENIDWTLVSYGNQNNPTAVLLITPNDITASFSGGSITGSSGCNTYFGTYTILGNSLTITIDGMTLMACNPPEVMTQESTYISALEAAQSYQLMGNKLKIVYNGGVLTFTTNQLPPLPPFDFSINLLPPSITVEAGQPANFQISLTYSDIAYSGTTVTIQVSGLGPGMTYQLTAQGGLIIQTLPSTPSGTYPMIIIGSAQGISHQTTGYIIIKEVVTTEATTSVTTVSTSTVIPPTPTTVEPTTVIEPTTVTILETPTTTETPTPQPTSSQTSLDELLPYLLIGILFIIIIILAVTLLLRRGRTPPYQRQPRSTSTGFCPNCGEPLKPGKPFCASCGKRVD